MHDIHQKRTNGQQQQQQISNKKNGKRPTRTRCVSLSACLAMHCAGAWLPLHALISLKLNTCMAKNKGGPALSSWRCRVASNIKITLACPCPGHLLPVGSWQLPVACRCSLAQALSVRQRHNELRFTLLHATRATPGTTPATTRLRFFVKCCAVCLPFVKRALHTFRPRDYHFFTAAFSCQSPKPKAQNRDLKCNAQIANASCRLTWA